MIKDLLPFLFRTPPTIPRDAWMTTCTMNWESPRWRMESMLLGVCIVNQGNPTKAMILTGKCIEDVFQSHVHPASLQIVQDRI